MTYFLMTKMTTGGIRIQGIATAVTVMAMILVLPSHEFALEVVSVVLLSVILPAVVGKNRNESRKRTFH